MDLVFLHEGHELEKESWQAEQEVNKLMDDERPPGGNLEFGVVVQHVAPGMFQCGLKGVFWQHCIYILHRQVRRAQDVGRAVHPHDGQQKVTCRSGEKTGRQEHTHTPLRQDAKSLQLQVDN